MLRLSSFTFYRIGSDNFNENKKTTWHINTHMQRARNES